MVKKTAKQIEVEVEEEAVEAESVETEEEKLLKKKEEQPQSRLKKLVLKGKAQGFLTYAEINDHLPENMHDTDQIEVVVNMINDMGIEVVDKAPDTDNLTLKRDNPESIKPRTAWTAIALPEEESDTEGP